MIQIVESNDFTTINTQYDLNLYYNQNHLKSQVESLELYSYVIKIVQFYRFYTFLKYSSKMLFFCLLMIKLILLIILWLFYEQHG